MESMIRDLLDFARGRLGGGLPIVPEWLDAGPLVHTAVDEVAHAHPDRNIQCCGMDGGDFRVHWDGDRVAQAIANLLGNAVAHGGDPIAVELFDLGDEIAIDVRNRGAIPPSILPRLFEPFSEPVPDRRRAAQPHEGAERRRHLGLGLYIVREISVAHGGQVDAASRDGEAIFRITLPRHAHPTQPMPTEVGPEIAVHARVSERRGDGDDRRRFSRTDRRKPLV
jgi:signal transduction histidine kinase